MPPVLRLCFLALLACAMLPAKAAIAQRLDTSTPQAEMMKRVSEAVSEYARSLGLEIAWIDYCRIEMQRKLAFQIMDGSLPYGFNYNTARAPRILETVISLLEHYERSDQIYCLSNVKNVLRAAGAPGQPR